MDFKIGWLAGWVKNLIDNDYSTGYGTSSDNASLTRSRVAQGSWTPPPADGRCTRRARCYAEARALYTESESSLRVQSHVGAVVHAQRLQAAVAGWWSGPLIPVVVPGIPSLTGVPFVAFVVGGRCGATD